MISQKGRILFILDPAQGHVTCYIRGLIFKDALLKLGWDIKYVALQTSVINNQKISDIEYLPINKIVALSKNYNIIYFIKVSSLPLIKQIKKMSNAKIIFDLTDALWRPNFRSGGWKNFKQRGWKDIEQILLQSDFITSENNFICSYGFLYNKIIFSIPVCTQIELFNTQNNFKHIDKKIRIGWVGSQYTMNALKKIVIPIKHIFSQNNNIELRLLGVPIDSYIAKQFSNINCIIIPEYDQTIMINEILNFDIGLFPPHLDLIDYELRGALKGMLYMSAKVPTIFQKSGDCLNFIKDGVNGMLADNLNEWEEKIELLINSESLRKEIGMNGYVTINETHSLAHVTTIMDNIFTSIMLTYNKNSPQQYKFTIIDYIRLFINKIWYCLSRGIK